MSADIATVCKLCGVLQDAVAEPRECSGRDSSGGHDWGTRVVERTVIQNSPDRNILEKSALITAVLAVLLVAVVGFWSPIQHAGVLAVAAVMALVEWVLSWPSWVWICLAILSAANRIVGAIDRHKEPQ